MKEGSHGGKWKVSWLAAFDGTEAKSVIRVIEQIGSRTILRWKSVHRCSANHAEVLKLIKGNCKICRNF